jgi:hypothetical protein
MEKEFVPYDRALRLKAIRFDEPCFGFYQKESAEIRPIMVDDNEQYLLTGYRTCKNSEIPEHYISAPTFSQVFRWFREKHNLYPSINIYNDKWLCVIKSTISNETEISGYIVATINNGHPTFDTYPEAELACLEKLIEIVENK